MAANSEINTLVKRLKGEGFWRSEAEREIREVARELMDNGFAPDEACELINKIWSTAVAEYGE